MSVSDRHLLKTVFCANGVDLTISVPSGFPPPDRRMSATGSGCVKTRMPKAQPSRHTRPQSVSAPGMGWPRSILMALITSLTTPQSGRLIRAEATNPENLAPDR